MAKQKNIYDDGAQKHDREIWRNGFLTVLFGLILTGALVWYLVTHDAQLLAANF